MDQTEKDTSQYFTGDGANDYHKVNGEHIREEWIEIITKTSHIISANILDAGCGSGLYTKYLRQITKGNVFGIDRAEDLLKIADKDQSSASSHITYKNVDLTNDICAALDLNPEYFDVVNSCWVLVHALNEQMLFKMIKNICNALKIGGVFVGITGNSEITLEDIQEMEELGLFYERKNPNIPLENGEKVHLRVRDGDAVWETDNYCYSRETYTKAFLEAGFSKVEFLPLRTPKVLTGNRIDELTKGGILYRAFK